MPGSNFELDKSPPSVLLLESFRKEQEVILCPACSRAPWAGSAACSECHSQRPSSKMGTTATKRQRTTTLKRSLFMRLSPIIKLCLLNSLTTFLLLQKVTSKALYISDCCPVFQPAIFKYSKKSFPQDRCFFQSNGVLFMLASHHNLHEFNSTERAAR